MPVQKVMQKMRNSKDKNEIGEKFLIEEFNSLRSFKEQSVLIADKRADSLLTLASAFVAGLGLLSQTKIDTENLLTIAAIGTLALLLIGTITFKQVIDRDILIVDYIRAINRIRAYFAEHAPQIQSFLLMPTSHEFPTYQWQSSNRRVPMVINGISIGVFVIVSDMLMEGRDAPTLILSAIGIISALLFYNVQSLYARRLFQFAEQKARERRTVSLFDSHQSFRATTRQYR